MTRSFYRFISRDSTWLLTTYGLRKIINSNTVRGDLKKLSECVKSLLAYFLLEVDRIFSRALEPEGDLWQKL